MSTIEDDFKQVLFDFKKKLTREEESKFVVTTLSDLERATNDLQEKQRKSKTARNLKRIQPFLQAMGQYKDTIEVFLNASSFLCFIWGPMKFLIIVSSFRIRSYFYLSLLSTRILSKS